MTNAKCVILLRVTREEVEEVRERNLSGGHTFGYLRLVHVFFTLVADIFQVIANCLFFYSSSKYSQ